MKKIILICVSSVSICGCAFGAILGSGFTTNAPGAAINAARSSITNAGSLQATGSVAAASATFTNDAVAGGVSLTNLNTKVAATNALYEARFTAQAATNTAHTATNSALQTQINTKLATNGYFTGTANYAVITNPPAIPSTNGLASTNYVNSATNTLWLTLSNSDWNTKQSVVAVSNAQAATAAALVVQSNYSFRVAAWTTNRFTAQAAVNATIFSTNMVDPITLGNVTNLVVTSPFPNALANAPYVWNPTLLYLDTSSDEHHGAWLNKNGWRVMFDPTLGLPGCVIGETYECRYAAYFRAGTNYSGVYGNGNPGSNLGTLSFDSPKTGVLPPFALRADGDAVRSDGRGSLTATAFLGNSAIVTNDLTVGNYTRLYDEGYNTILRNDYGDIVLQPDGNFRTTSVYSPSGGYLYLYSDNTLTLGASGGIVFNDSTTFNGSVNFNGGGLTCGGINVNSSNITLDYGVAVNFNSSANAQFNSGSYVQFHSATLTLDGSSTLEVRDSSVANFRGAGVEVVQGYFNFDSGSEANFYNTPTFSNGLISYAPSTFYSAVNFDAAAYANFNCSPNFYNGASFYSGSFADFGGGGGIKTAEGDAFIPHTVGTNLVWTIAP